MIFGLIFLLSSFGWNFDLLDDETFLFLCTLQLRGILWLLTTDSLEAVAKSYQNKILREILSGMNKQSQLFNHCHQQIIMLKTVLVGVQTVRIEYYEFEKAFLLFFSSFEIKYSGDWSYFSIRMIPKLLRLNWTNTGWDDEDGYSLADLFPRIDTFLIRYVHKVGLISMFMNVHTIADQYTLNRYYLPRAIIHSISKNVNKL